MRPSPVAILARLRAIQAHLRAGLDRPVAIAAGLIAAYAFVVLGGVPDPVLRALLDNLGSVLGALAAAGLALMAARAQATRRARASWLLLGAGLVCWGLGDAAWTWVEATTGASPPTPSLADVGYLAMVPLMFAGILLRPTPRLRTGGRWLLLADSGLALSAVVAVAWTVVLGPMYARLDTDPLVQAVTLAYPLGDLAILCCLLIAIFRESETRPATGLLLLGLGLLAIADSAYSALVVHGAYATGHPVDVVWFSALVLVGLAATMERNAQGAALPDPPPAGPVEPWRFVIPTAMLAGATILVWGVALTQRDAQVGPGELALGAAWLFLLGRALIEYRAAAAALRHERQLRVDHAGSFRREQQRRRQLEAVRDIAAELTRELDLTVLLTLITRRSAGLVEAPIGAALEWDAAEGLLMPRAWHGLSSWFASVRIRPGEGIAGRAVEQRRGIIVNDGVAARDASQAFGGRLTFTAVLAMPVILGGRLLGAIVVADTRPGRTFAEHDLTLLALFADQAAVAIEHAHLVDRAASAEALRELAHLKTELLSTVSHELRTPLTLIHGYAELLRVRAEALSPADVAMMADEVLLGSRTMIRLVDDLLDFSRIDTTRLRLERERVDLADLLRRHVHAWESQPGGHRLRLEAPAPAVALVDPARVDQIARNLIANALAYAPNGPVVVRVAGESDAVRVEVVDRGPGIPHDEQPRVWETFFRGQGARTSPNRGSGLGLAVVRQLVELHGGRVEVHSAVGEGATFRLWLPRRPALPTLDGAHVEPDPLDAEAGEPLPLEPLTPAQLSDQPILPERRSGP